MTEKPLPKYITDRGITYALHGDYYYPLIVLKQTEKRTIGKYGMLRRVYLMEHKKARYQIMLLNETLMEHLADVDEMAQEMMDRIVDQIARAEGVTEALKAQDSMLWLRRMNNIRNRAEEIVLSEIVYR
ncbi:MAG: TnpV protein [Lachnospiraceae bacterium]|nr:TnpV protein [Lachnospiraceae bacterium]